MRWLYLVWEGGRALSLRALGTEQAAGEAGMTDFDFYPGVHRRSIKVSSGTLCLALRQRAPAQVACQLDALRLSARQRGRRLAKL